MNIINQIPDLLLISLLQGGLYGLLTLGLVFSFRIVRFPDLTVDGSFVLGASVAASSALYYKSPFLGTGLAFLAGGVSGIVTGLLHIKLKINRILCGILVATMLYTVNLHVMRQPSVFLYQSNTMFARLEAVSGGQIWEASLIGLTTIILYLAFGYLLKSKFGLYLRATGENEGLVFAMGRDANKFLLAGLALANALVAFSGAFVVQAYGSAFVDMGTGILVVGLACLFIVERPLLLLMPSTGNRNSVLRTLTVAASGAVLYFFIRNAALRMHLNPNDFKLATAVLVVVVLSIPTRRGLQLSEEKVV